MRCSKTGRLSYRTHSQAVCTKTVVCGKARIIMQHTNPHPPKLVVTHCRDDQTATIIILLLHSHTCIKTQHLYQNTTFTPKHQFCRKTHFLPHHTLFYRKIRVLQQTTQGEAKGWPMSCSKTRKGKPLGIITAKHTYFSLSLVFIRLHLKSSELL